MAEIALRDVVEEDLPVFFAHQQDAEAVWMAAFTAKDPANETAFYAHWRRNLANETNVTKTILVDGKVAGHVARFVQDGQPELTYWIGREFWGQGVATKALSTFLGTQAERPIYARAAKDNLASIRVLEKCGFSVTGFDKGFANARGEEIDEVVFALLEAK